MEYEQNKILNHKKRTSNCEELLKNNDYEKEKFFTSFHETNNDDELSNSEFNIPVFHRSNSITIPTGLTKHLSSDASISAYSRSYTSGHCDITNYGAINNHRQTNSIRSMNKKLSRSVSSDSSKADDCNHSTDVICFGLNKRQLKVFLSLVLLSLNEIMGYSAIAPFFPIVAESKGLSSTSYGLIFAAYSLCGIVASLIIGTVLVKVGAKFCVLAGMFLNTGALFCFGFLDQMEPTPFLVLSIISRGLMGFGCNAAFTAMFAIVFQEFNDRAITILSLSESLVGVGGMVAPLIGGGLYDIGGFITPFMVLGSAQIILLIACWSMLPHVPIQDRVASRFPFYLLTHSSAFIATLMIIYVFFANSFIIANIGPFLDAEFKLDATMIGVVLLVSSLFYAGMSPIWGYVADRWKNSYLMEGCTLGLCVGLTFAGPAWFLRRWFGWQHQRLWLSFITAAVMGMFFGGALMPTFNEMLTAASELQLSDTILVQYGLVSGLWNTAFAVGDILGPTVGGLILEHVDFPTSSFLFALLGISLVCLKLLQRFYRYKTRHRRNINSTEDEAAPLLADSDSDHPVV